MDASESSIKTWLKFFMDASIPAGAATEYAISFSDNRMRLDMLPDLTKDYLHDLNITVLGDVIAILKHAKAVSQKEYTARKVGSDPTLDVAAASAVAPATPRTAASTESPAARMVKRLVRKDPPPPPPPAKRSIDAMDSDAGVECSGKRLKASGRVGSSPLPATGGGKKTVFDRLGGDNQVTSTTPDSTRFRITGLSLLPSERSLLPADAEMSGSAREVRAGQRVTMVTGPGLAYKGVLKGGGRTDREDYQMLRRKTERKAAEPAKAMSTLAMDREQKAASARARLGASAKPLVAASASPRLQKPTQLHKAAAARPQTVPSASRSITSRLGEPASGTKGTASVRAGSVRSRLGTVSR